jgi:hypothetical protein
MIGLFIPDPDPDFLPIPDPGSRGQKGTGSGIRNTDPWDQLCLPGAQGGADVITVLHSCDGFGEQVLQLNSVPVLIAALLVVGPNRKIKDTITGLKISILRNDADPS